MAGLKIQAWDIENKTGYHPTTSVYTDLCIAEAFGEPAIRQVCQNIFDNNKENHVYIGELLMALRSRKAEHQKGDGHYVDLYYKLADMTEKWCYRHFTQRERYKFDCDDIS